MIKVEVTENFTLNDFEKLKNIVRATSRNEEGHLYIKDTFECDEEMVDYLMGGNDKNKTVVKILEVIPEVHIKNEINIDGKKIIEEINKEKPKKKTSRKKKEE